MEAVKGWFKSSKKKVPSKSLGREPDTRTRLLIDESVISKGPQRKNVNMAKVRRLPPTFAQDVLDCEINLESRPTPETVQRLFQLYEQAVEYFNIKGDIKFQYYETKIQALMVRPDIMMSLNTQEEHKVDAKSKLIKQMQRNSVMLSDFKHQHDPQWLQIVQQQKDNLIKVQNNFNVVRQQCQLDIKRQSSDVKQRVLQRKVVIEIKALSLEIIYGILGSMGKVDDVGPSNEQSGSQPVVVLQTVEAKLGLVRMRGQDKVVWIEEIQSEQGKIVSLYEAELDQSKFNKSQFLTK